MEVKSHTSLKHRLLGYYFKFCRDVLISNRNKIKTLYYIDLYCSDGETKDDLTGDKYLSPFIEALMKKGVVEKGLDIKFILNDLESEKIAKMKKLVSECGCTDCVIKWGNCWIHITQVQWGWESPRHLFLVIGCTLTAMGNY